MNPLRYIKYTTLLFLFPVLLSGQSFMVMSLKGKVEVQKGTVKKVEWTPLKIGDQLSNDAVVRTSFASYAKLMMDQKRLVSIDENTTKKLAEFRGGDGRSNGGASGSLLQYAASQMKKTREPGQDNVFGAVRGDMDMVSAVFPKHAVMTTEPLFRWVDPSEEGKYEVLLLDADFKVIARMQSGEHALRYMRDELPALDNDREYHWRVTRTSDGLESGIETFRILSRDSIAVIVEELGRLDAELRDMGADDVTLHLIRGVYFEKKGLLTDAYGEYVETMRLAPEVTEYRDMLRALLFQMKLYNEEELLLKQVEGVDAR